MKTRCPVCLPAINSVEVGETCVVCGYHASIEELADQGVRHPSDTAYEDLTKTTNQLWGDLRDLAWSDPVVNQFLRFQLLTGITAEHTAVALAVFLARQNKALMKNLIDAKSRAYPASLFNGGARCE